LKFLGAHLRRNPFPQKGHGGYSSHLSCNFRRGNNFGTS